MYKKIEYVNFESLSSTEQISVQHLIQSNFAPNQETATFSSYEVCWPSLPNKEISNEKKS